MRVWWETNSEQPFRARFVAVDVDGGTTEVGVVANPEAALATVRQWIEEATATSRESPTKPE